MAIVYLFLTACFVSVGGGVEALHCLGKGQPAPHRRPDFGDQEGPLCLRAMPPMPLPSPGHLVRGGPLPTGVLQNTLRKRGER